MAADRGLCILDLNQRELKDRRQFNSRSLQWKMFSRVNEERSFRVLHMVWWNRNESKRQDRKREDDIVVAIIQYAQSDGLHLVGWSRRR